MRRNFVSGCGFTLRLRVFRIGIYADPVLSFRRISIIFDAKESTMQENEDNGLYTVFGYSDIFFTFYSSSQKRCSSMVVDHQLVYVYSGEYTVTEGGKETKICAGECAFLRRDNRVNVVKQGCDGRPFMGIFMVFKRAFLRAQFASLGKKGLPAIVGRIDGSVVKLPHSPDITGLFQSMLPYFDSGTRPSEEMMNLKLVEGVYSLLNIDNRFFPTLFDFTEPWKIDILDFMNSNYMYVLSLEEIASFTGRSLSTFKRDFRKVSELSPQKWLIKRRLEAAREMLEGGKRRISDVYVDVGFKNLSHFSAAFKREYGVAPSSLA